MTPQGLVSRTVALVEPDEDGDPRPFCTGVWVSPSQFVTANHCLHGQPAVPYVTAKALQAPHYAISVAIDEKNDLALMGAVEDLRAHDWATIASASPTMAMPVQTMSHPQWIWYSYSNGVIAGLRNIDGTLTVQTTAPVSRGSSGCGLFDANGDLVGILHGTVTTGQNLNFFVHASYVAKLMEAAK